MQHEFFLTSKSSPGLDKVPGTLCSLSNPPTQLSQNHSTDTVGLRCLRVLFQDDRDWRERCDHTCGVVELVVVHGHAGEDGALSDGGGGHAGGTVPQRFADFLYLGLFFVLQMI